METDYKPSRVVYIAAYRTIFLQCGIRNTFDLFFHPMRFREIFAQIVQFINFYGTQGVGSIA